MQSNDKKRYSINLKPLIGQKPQRNEKNELNKQIFFLNKRQKEENPVFDSINTKGSTKNRENSKNHHKIAITVNEFPTVFFNDISEKIRNSKSNKSLENYDKIQSYTTRPMKSILFNEKNEENVKKRQKSTLLVEKKIEFKDFLTPREKKSNLLIKEPNSIENFSKLTQINNNLFNKHMNIINMHEKKRLNLENSFRKSLNFKEKEEISQRISGFITQRTQEDDTFVIIDIEKTKNCVLLGKFAFLYFFLKIKNRESPLKVGNYRGIG